MKKILYRLEHNHFTNGYAQNLYIGTFVSLDIVEKVIDELITQSGFNKHPKHCFRTIEVEVDKLLNWEKGFEKIENEDIELK